MSDTQKSLSGSDPTPKKRSLDSLIPEKQVVLTSIGELFVRHMNLSDLVILKNDEEENLGLAAVQQFCSRVKDKRDKSTLTGEDLSKLTTSDFQLITSAIANRNKWEELPSDARLLDLGQVVKTRASKDFKSLVNISQRLHSSLKSSYGFLNTDVLEKLQTQMGSLNRLQFLGKTLEQAQAQLNTPISSPIVGDAIRRSRLEDAEFLQQPIQLPKITPPEETALGRATIENANYSKQSIEKIDSLVEIVAGLNKTVIVDILPAWVKKFEDDQVAGKDSFEQAARGLWWTQIAVYVSVAVTVFTTGLQVWVAYDLDNGNTIQQEKVEVALREQLAAQRTMIEQQAREGALLREALQALRPPAPIEASKAVQRSRP